MAVSVLGGTVTGLPEVGQLQFSVPVLVSVWLPVRVHDGELVVNVIGVVLTGSEKLEGSVGEVFSVIVVGPVKESVRVQVAAAPPVFVARILNITGCPACATQPSVEALPGSSDVVTSSHVVPPSHETCLSTVALQASRSVWVKPVSGPGPSPPPVMVIPAFPKTV